jgi:type 1 glutamine amidotransferase
MKKIISIPVLACMILALAIFSCAPPPEIRALIVTGQNNHNWRGSSVALKIILEEADIFSVAIATSPREGRDMAPFIIDFSPYDLVILDYNGDEWPDETKNNFLSFIENGGGVVVYHAANNAFTDWEAYNEIIGLGGWGGRDEKSGPYVYVKDGEVIRDNSAGRGGSHGSQHEFVVEAFQAEHPIMKGLPLKWLHSTDELYSELRGPAENLEILATAYADKEFQGTEKNEPVLFTVKYGEGRIFHTTLGHAGNNDLFYPAMECAGFITSLQRGAEWAATGKVTQKVPKGLPDDKAAVRWEFYTPMDIDIISKKIRKYDIGMRTTCFVALKEYVARAAGDQVEIDEYNDLIMDILKSGSASKEGKKVLLKEYSWMATSAFQPVYEKLSKDPDLKDEALFALERLNI